MDRIESDENSITFSPIMTSDTGLYSCELTLLSLEPHVIFEDESKIAQINITVQSMLRNT